MVYHGLFLYMAALLFISLVYYVSEIPRLSELYFEGSRPVGSWNVLCFEEPLSCDICGKGQPKKDNRQRRCLGQATS